MTEKQQEKCSKSYWSIKNEKQQSTPAKESLKWLAGKIKMFTEEEQEAILASALSFAEHDLIVAPSISIQPQRNM